MPLFSNEVTPEYEAAERVVIMRERGTRALLLVTVSVIALWLVGGKIKDHYLLQKQWEPLTHDAENLTVVGVLDRRGDYDHNFFKVVQSNKMTRVEMTGTGWDYCFPSSEGSLFDPDKGEIIKGVQSVDGKAGDAMLIPYIKAGIDRYRQIPNASAAVSADMPIQVEGEQGKPATLGEMLKKYQEKKRVKDQETKEEGGGSGASSTVEHGTVVAGNILVRACPILLTTKCFSSAELIPQPASALADEMYAVRLNLTPEGRSRFYRWSREHENESIVFVVKGKVTTAGRVTQTLDVNWWEISNIRDKESAQTLVDAVNQYKR